MAVEAVGRLTSFLDAFQPRSFQSDQQAAQYAFNSRKQPWSTPELQRLHMDWDEANESLQAGEMDPTTEKFVTMMDRAMVPTSDDMIVSQTVPTEAFGMSPQQAALEDGGLEDFIGLEIADAGYTATNLGSELSHPPGSVTLRVAVPKGTKVAYGGRSPNDRGVILDRDQPLIVTKVEPDGRGGWYVLAIAASGKRTKGATQVADDRTFGRRGAGLTPEQREARISPQMSGEQRLKIAQQNEREMQTGPSTVTPAPGATQAPAPAAPASPASPAPPAAGVPERREPVQSESVGPGSPEGKSASDIAADADTARVQAENAPPAPAAAPTPLEFQEASRDLPIPTAGPQRNEWNKAHSGLAQGKRDPGDVLRELDTDIEENKRKAASATHAEKKDSLERNIQAQEQLADLIAERYGVQRRATSAPVAKKAPTPTPGAPSTARGTAPKVKAPEAAPDRRTKAQLLEEAGDAGRPRMTKDQLRQAIEAKKGGGEAPKKAAAPETRSEMRKRTAGPGLSDEQKADIKAKAARTDDRMAKEQADFDTKNKADLDPLLETAGLQESDLDDLDKTGASLILGQVREKKISKTEGVRRLKASKSEQLRRLGDALETKPRKAAPAKAVAKKATPAKAAPSPEDAAEEAFKARVTEAGLPDRVTALRAMARDQKIRGFSTMNKRQLQSALLGDEVPKAGKIGVVSPKKMVPHLQAADSDQAARALLKDHTLTDLKALAKERELELPKKGATKPRVLDMVLEDIRGPQEGITGRTPDTSLEGDLGQLGYIDLPGANGDKIKQEISQVDGNDADSLRQRRDDLEKLSKQFRSDGDKDAANMAQAAADAMGMRAQTISGVEEATPPVKRVAKKAAPAVPEGEEAPEVERPLEKMLKPELLAVAQREGASSVRPSWSKARILDEIKKNRRMDSSRGAETADDRLRRELGQLPGGPERDLGPNQGPLQLPDRAPTAEEIARDAVPGAPAPTKKATKKAAKKAVADVDRAADTVSEQLKGTFGDQLRGMDPEELRQAARTAGVDVGEGNTAEEIFDNTIKKMLESRMRELGMLPEDPAKPTRAQKRVPKGSVPGRTITTPDRKQSFREAWDGQKLQATGTSAGSLDEVRDDIESGKITPEEGVRRLDSDILFNEDESNDLLAQLEGMEESDREESDLNLQRALLEENIRAQKKAKTFIRDHFKDEAPVTRQELEVQLDGPEKAALDRVDVGDLKQAARQEGLGNIEGDDKDTVVQNIAKAVAARELKTRAAAKAVPAAAPEAPTVPTPAKKAAKFLPPLKDGTQRKSFTNVEVGDVVKRAGSKGEAKRVTKVERGPGGVDLTFEDGTTVNGNPNTAAWMGRDAPEAPTAPTPTPDAPAPVKAAKKAPGRTVPGAPEGWKAQKTGDGTYDVYDASGERVGSMRQEDLEIVTAGEDSLGRITRRKQWQFTPAEGGMEQAVRSAKLGDALTSLDFQRRGGAQALRAQAPTAPETPAPKAAVPTKAAPAPPKVVDLDNPTRHDAEVIGTGLDLDPKGEDRQWMDVVQRSLDRGEDGRQIADGLRREADSQRTLHNITESVGGTEGASPSARINRMELMADRLEGVRPIKKAAPPAAKVSTPDKREMGTMQAATAQSKALFDLRNGKSHAEVATALRQAATSVGSRDHDPQTVRPLEFTPAERSAMKRGDAKKLRELAADIQAQGVAQRAEARATKKAASPAGKKAAKAQAEFVDRMAGERAAFKDLGDKPASKTVPAKAPAPKKRTAAEMRRAQMAAENSEKSVDEILAGWDQQKEDRKNLTGPVGEMIAAQIEDAHQALLAADTPARESEATGRLLHPELRTWATKLGLSPSGNKRVLEQRIADRIKGREAPGASAGRAVPKVEAPSAGAVNESEPLKPFPHDDNMRMHADSPIMQLAFAYERAGRNGSANRMAQLRARATTPAAFDTNNGIPPQQVVDELKALRAQETDSRFQRMLDSAIEANDAPMTPMPELPADTPPLARKLIEDLHAIPHARKSKANGDRGASGPVRGDSLVDQLAAVYRDAAQGKRGGLGGRQPPDARIRDILRGQTHEMNDAAFRIWELVSRLESGEQGDTGAKRSALLKELMDWERSHWPPQ